MIHNQKLKRNSFFIKPVGIAIIKTYLDRLTPLDAGLTIELYGYFLIIYGYAIKVTVRSQLFNSSYLKWKSVLVLNV